jgi:hypothetical protein
MELTLYRKHDHIDDPPEGSIYVADSYEEPWLTMVPVTVDFEAAGRAAWFVVARVEGLIDEGLQWDDLVASDSQSFWVGVGKAAVAAAIAAPN